MALISERHVQDAFVVIPQDSRKNALRAGMLPTRFFTFPLLSKSSSIFHPLRMSLKKYVFL